MSNPTLGHHRAPGGEVIGVNDNIAPPFVRPPNGTVLHIREVLLSPGPPATCSPFLDPACYILQPEAEGAPLRMQGN